MAAPGFHPASLKETAARLRPGSFRRYLPKISPADLKKPSVLALIAANLIPLYGVLVLHWEIFPLIFLYWSENVIIGVINVLRLLTASPRDVSSWIMKIFFIPFFCFHYGVFTGVHGIFVMAFFGPRGAMDGGPFPSVSAFVGVIREYRLFYPILSLALSHVFSFFVNYLGKGRYKTASLDNLMMLPYSRIIILHVTILLGGFLMMVLRAPVAGLVLLVALKIFFDLGAHLREHAFVPGAGVSKSPEAPIAD